MNVSIIFSIIFTAALCCCMVLAWKRDWVKSLLSLAVSAISLIEAYIFSRLFIRSGTERLSEQIKKQLWDILDLSGPAADSTAVEDLYDFALNILLGMISFLLLFLLLRLINNILKRLIFSKAAGVKYSKFSSRRKIPAVSVAASLLSFIICTFAVLYPLGASSSIALSASHISGTSLPTYILTNPIIRAYGIPGRPFFDAVTRASGEEEFKSSDEIQKVIEIAIVLKRVSDGGYGDETSINYIVDSLRSSYLFTGIASEFVANAAEAWKKGEDYMNISVEIPEGRGGTLMVGVLDILSRWERDDLIRDIDTVIEVSKICDKYEVDKIGDGSELFAALCNENFTEELFMELFSNEDFSAAVPLVVQFGIGTALDTVKEEMKDEYNIEFNEDGMSEEEIAEKAREFSEMLNEIRDGQR